jgi:hypothetical protein
MKRRNWFLLAFSIAAGINCAFLFPSWSVAQQPPDAPILKPGDKADALFVASSSGIEKDENGQPALASLDPVAFFVDGKIHDCATTHPAPGEENVPKATIQTLNRFYTAGRHYPLFSGGGAWGESQAVKSCIHVSIAVYRLWRRDLTKL